MTGAVSTSAPTVVGVRAAIAGTSSPRPRVLRPEGYHDATGGTVGGQIGYRWQAGTWVFGVEAQGNWADFKGSNTSLLFPGFRNKSQIDAFGLFTGQVGYAANNVLLYVKGGAAVTSDSTASRPPPTRSLAPPATTPAGAARSASASNTASLRTGRLASNTITCSCRTAPTPSPRRRGALRHRSHPSGRRSRHRPPELQVRWPGRRAVTDFRNLRPISKPRALPGAFLLCAEHDRQLGGGSPLSSLMAAKD